MGHLDEAAACIRAAADAVREVVRMNLLIEQQMVEAAGYIRQAGTEGHTAAFLTQSLSISDAGREKAAEAQSLADDLDRVAAMILNAGG